MRIAIVSYYAPPQKAVASHRVLRLTRTLLLAGHDVHWVTADVERFADPAESLDPSLASLVPTAVNKHSIGSQALLTVPVARSFLEKVKRTLLYEASRRLVRADGFFGWASLLRRRLPALVRQHQIDAVLVCCGPHSQLACLPRLRRSLPQRLRLYADYRDLLSGNPWNTRGSTSRQQRLLAWERDKLRHVDGVFVNTDTARQRFLSVVGQLPGVDVTVMRNAADYVLGEEICASAATPDLGPGVHLGFFGTVFPRRRLLPVLRAMASMGVELNELTLHVYCDPLRSAQLLEEDLAALGERREVVAARVQRHAYLPYQDALRTMRAMHALMLVNGPTEDDAVFVPGKIYDYFMALRPIAFVGHSGDASRMVAEACGESACFYQDGKDAGDAPEGLAGWLGDLVRGQVEAPRKVASFGIERTFEPLLERLAASPADA